MKLVDDEGKEIEGIGIEAVIKRIDQKGQAVKFTLNTVDEEQDIIAIANPPPADPAMYDSTPKMFYLEEENGHHIEEENKYRKILAIENENTNSVYFSARKNSKIKYIKRKLKALNLESHKT